MIISASSRSRGDGCSPAISFLIVLRLRGIASWVNTSSPDILLTMLRSTTPGKVNDPRYPGRFIEYPSQYRQSVLVAFLSSVYQSHEFFLSSISSEVLSLFRAALLAFFGLTPQPPFPSVVLAMPGGEQSRPDQKIRSLRQFIYRSIQGVEILLLFPPVGCLLFAPSPFMLIFESSDLPHYSAADVLSDYPPVLLAAPRVVEAAPLSALPAHFLLCYLLASAPLLFGMFLASRRCNATSSE